jgi:hypothetical protein
MLVFQCIWYFHLIAQQNQYSMSDQFPISFDQNENTTAQYEELIDFYKKLSDASPYLNFSSYGMTDAGAPIPIVVIAAEGDFTPESNSKKNKAILFINNGIHPGEPCGIDASMILARALCLVPKLTGMLDSMTIVMIPIYNIGGMLNRSASARANQNGPEYYGFRGNAKNLDLNRDFIKCDSKNAQSFNRLFNQWSPHVFIDTHTSNGADYPYVMTLIATQKDRLPPAMGEYLQHKMLPSLYESMQKHQYEMIPYVNTRDIPDKGIYGFLDTPRYSSGYAALHHSYAFMPEAHMLKPYNDRVWSTYYFLLSSIQHLVTHKHEIMESIAQATEAIQASEEYPLRWQLDKEKTDSLGFRTYKADYKPSAVTGQARLFYDGNKEEKKNIPYYQSYQVEMKVLVPEAYIIPQAWLEVIERLQWNGVEMHALQEDIILEVEMYRIQDLKTSPKPYEGRYPHTEISVYTETTAHAFRAGDYLIPVRNRKMRYIIECLEPHGHDSFFSWNFFDAVLSQKEYFSTYVFEDLALEILENDPVLKKAFYEKKSSEKGFANDSRAQLNYIYKNSDYYEKTHNLYPVARYFQSYGNLIKTPKHGK